METFPLVYDPARSSSIIYWQTVRAALHMGMHMDMDRHMHMVPAHERASDTPFLGTWRDTPSVGT